MFVPDTSLTPAEQVKLLSSSFVKLLLLSELNIMLSRMAAEEHFAPKHHSLTSSQISKIPTM